MERVLGCVNTGTFTVGEKVLLSMWGAPVTEKAGLSELRPGLCRRPEGTGCP